MSVKTWTPARQRVHKFSRPEHDVTRLKHGVQFIVALATMSAPRSSRRSSTSWVPLQVVESNALFPDAEPPLARDIDELADHDKLWRAMHSLSSSYVKLAKEIEESAASAVVPACRPTRRRLPATALGAKRCLGVAHWCARGRDHVCGGRIRRRLRHCPPTTLSATRFSKQRPYLWTFGVLSAVATGTASGVSYGEAYEEMEELSVDIIGYGMSVVAKDTVPWCRSRGRSTSRRQTSASLGQPTAECRFCVSWCLLVRAWERGSVATATTPAVVKLATKMEESSVNAVCDGMLPLSLPTARRNARCSWLRKFREQRDGIQVFSMRSSRRRLLSLGSTGRKNTVCLLLEF